MSAKHHGAVAKLSASPGKQPKGDGNGAHANVDGFLYDEEGKPVAMHFELRYFPFPTEVHCFKSTHKAHRKNTWKVKVFSHIPHRAEGTPEYFGVDGYVEFSRTPTKAMLKKKLSALVRDCLHRHLAHEADEALHFAGVRLFDPHSKRKAKR